MLIDRNEERILIKISDENFNIYKCIITDDDLFVVNFCKRNLEKMEKILKNGSIVNIGCLVRIVPINGLWYRCAVRI